MHTHVCANGVVIHYNADLSGEAHIVGLPERLFTNEHVEVRVPWADLAVLLLEDIHQRFTIAVEDALDKTVSQVVATS
jgi:hypothetical protein